jgi:ubiquinone/menaquinone biosynthesis C-methylase UbiE
MKVSYGWNPQYTNPEHWNFRTPLHMNMPKFFLIYQNLNDKKLRKFLRKQEGFTLDAGCGTGRFVEYANIGVDFSSGMLKRAKSKTTGAQFVRASISCLPFKRKIFSIAFSVDVLLHISPKMRKKTIKELNRVAKKSYIFLAEHRTVIPFIYEIFRKIHLVGLSSLFPYVSIFLAFPLDRIRKLQIDSPSLIMSKLS